MAPRSRALSRIPLGRALIALGLVLVAINIAAAIWDVRKAHERTERRAQRYYSNMTRLLAEQTAASLEAVDLILRDAVRTGSARQVAATLPRVGEELVRVPQIGAMLVLDAQGTELARTSDTPAYDPDYTARPYFVFHRDNPKDVLHLGQPYRVAPGGQWRFILSRRLSGADGRFEGVVAAAVEVESFDRLYHAIDIGEGGFLTVLTDAGMLITRVPDTGNVRGRSFRGPVMEGVRNAERFEGWTTSPISSDRVLLAASRVRGFPLVVASGSNEEAVLAPWREEAWLIFDRTALTTGAIIALIALAAWGLARRERALARSWQRYQAMIENSSDALILSRPLQGGILYASPAIERILGYTMDEMRGREVMDFIHPDAREAALRAREDLLRVPRKVSVDETQVLCKDGSWRWIELTRANLLAEPSVRAVVFNFRDITERKLAEAERGRLEARLRQAEKMEAVGRLAGGIAHDFNNILGGILGYAEMLSEKAPPGSPLKRYADNVLTGANRASSLVEQILSYSRSQRGRRLPVEIGRVIGETLELVRGSLPAGVRLEADLPAQDLYVVGDPTQLHQVTMNLCTNAIHAMPSGGVLRVRLESAEVAQDRALAHSTLQAGAYARLMVEDTGTGMDEATLARIFEPFFTTKEVGKGTGLGLALVYGIVTDSAGAIDVTSRPGEGSCFAIYLPRVEAPTAARDAAAAGPVARGNGERVLVVDDEEALVAVTAEVLKHIGYEPVACADGAAAIAAFDAGRIDAVIADEVMPGISGTELAQALRKRRADLPFVLVSGYTGPMLTQRALGVGVTEILKKPVQSRDIAAALARVLRRAA